MPLKENSFITDLMSFISEASKLLPLPFETPYGWVKRQRSGGGQYFYTSLNRLKKKGYLKVIEKNNKKFLQITKKGQLELLLAKAKIQKNQKWDGKWRMVIFDIPEAHREKRNLLRLLLKKGGFKKLQGSVFVSPHPLNREAIKYLKQTGLISFIRIIRIEEIDSDNDLRKMFNQK